MLSYLIKAFENSHSTSPYRELPRAAALDLWQHFIYGGVFCNCLAERNVQAQEQLRHGFLIAAYERDTDFLAFCRQSRAANRRDLPDCDLAAGGCARSAQVMVYGERA